MVARTTNPIELSIAPDIRAALERVLASKEFIRANQLCEFLSYVVTAALEGHSDRLKGYTIGVEALGKSPDFDPQIDPIVRVEAIRLRRALAGYYATSGRNDTLVIDIPRGSYIPTFRRRSLPLGLRKYPLGAQRSVVLHAIRRWRLLAQIALLAAVISLAMDIAMVTLWRGASPIPHAPAPNGDQVQAKQSASIFPLLFVEPFDVTSLSNDAALAVARLGNKLRDALAHFDEIKVTSTRYTERQQSSVTAHRFTRNGYRLAASAEERSDGTLDLSLRLYDEDDGTIVWTRLLDGVRLPNAAITNEKNIVQWLAPTIAQPYGVIYSREVAKGAADNGDPRYSCVVKAFEHYRWRDSTRSESILACVSQISNNPPGFASGLAALAVHHLRNYYNAGDLSEVDRAMDAAQRAIALDPESARAHQAMMNVLFARGQFAAALEEGRKAVLCNPWDTIVLNNYAIRLLWSGDTAQGTALLQQAEDFGSGQPQFHYFAMFVTAYSRGDDPAAARYMLKLTNENSGYGLAARAIAAVRSGERERAQRELQKLEQLRPLWSANARLLFERYGAPADIVARFAGDLDAAAQQVD